VYQSVIEVDEHDQEALSELARLYQLLQRYEDQLNIFARQKEYCEEQNGQDEFEVQRALLFRDQLADPFSSLDALKGVVAHQPQHAQAREILESLLTSDGVRLDVAETLVPLYEADEQWDTYVAILHDTLDERIDLDDRVEILRKVAYVEEEHLNRLQDAFNSLAHAYRLGQVEEIESDLERLAYSVKVEQELVDLFNEVVPDLPEREISLRSKVAEIAQERLQDYDTAIEAHREILHQEPERLASLDALEHLFALTEDYTSLADVFHQKLEVIEETEQRSNLFDRLATLYEEALDNSIEAIEIWRKQLEEDETHHRALSELERLLNLNESYAELAVHYEEWATRCDEVHDQIVIKTKLAQVQEDSLLDGLTAVELYQEILTLDPQYEPVQDRLTALFNNPERAHQIGADRRQIAEILDPIYRNKGDLSALVPVLDVQQEGEMDPSVRANLLLELAQIQEESLLDRHQAFQSRLIALRLNPEIQENRLKLQSLAPSVDGFSDLAQGLEEASVDVLELDLKNQLLLELGRVVDVYLEEYDRACECYREILLDTPDHSDAIRALETLFASRYRYQDLVDLYLKLSDETDEEDQQIRRLFQAAETLGNLDEPDQLIEIYRKILEINPTHAEAFKDLERLFTLQDRWNDLADLLLEQTELADNDEQKAHLRHRLASVYEERLNLVDDAIEMWRLILNENQDTFEPAYQSLERLVLEWRPQGIEEPRIQVIAEILAPLYHQTQQWIPWLQTQEDLTLFEFDPFSKADLLKECARIYEEELNQPQDALTLLGRAFEHNFGEMNLQIEMDRLTELTGSWDTLVRLYLNGLDEFQDLEDALALWMKVAGIFETKLHNGIEATRCYQKAHYVDEVQLAPLIELERIYEETSQFSELVEILKKKAFLAEELEDKKADLFRVGTLYRGPLALVDDAIDTYRLILQEDPEDLKAIQTLESLFEKETRWPDLVLLLQDKLNVVEEEDAQKRTHHQMAHVYASELNNQDEAMNCWRMVLELAPLDEKALSSLKQALRTNSSWGELLALFEEERSHYEDDQRQATQLDLEIAQLYAEVLDQPLNAIEMYRSILERDPHEEEARGALEFFLNQEQTRGEAAHALEIYYQERNDASALVRVLDTQLIDLDDPFDQARIYKNQARLKRDELNDPIGAFNCFTEALKVDLQDEESLEALQEIGGTLSLFEKMAAVYQELATYDPHSETAVSLYRRRAKLCEFRLQDLDSAIEAWQNVRNVEAEDEEALKALTKLFESESRFEELIEILQTRVIVEPDEYGLRIQLGHLLETSHQDQHGALEQWKQVVMDFPDVIEAQETLEARFHLLVYLEEIAQILDPIYRDRSDWVKLMTLHQARLNQGSIDDVFQQEELWMECGQVYLRELNQKQHAFESFCQAFRLNSTQTSVRDHLFDLVDELTAWSTLRPFIEESLTQVRDPEMAAQDHLRLAQWAETHFNDLDRAVIHYQDAFKLDEEQTQALSALERIFESRQDWSSLAQILTARLNLTFDDDQRIPLLMTIGQLRFDRLDRTDEAIRAYEDVLLMDDTHVEAYNALENILISTQKSNELIALLERKVSALSLSDEDNMILYQKIAEIYESIGEHYQASDAYRQILSIDPDSQTALTRLQALFTHLEMWDDLKEIKDQLLQNATGDQKITYALELAQLCRTSLDMPDDALEYYQLITEVNPAHRDAFEQTRQILTEQMRWDDLCDLLDNYLQSQHGRSNEEVIQFRIELAKYAEEEGESQRAIDHLNQVLSLDPNHAPALTVLAQLYEREEEWDQATSTLEKALQYAQPGQQKSEAWTRLGLIHLHYLDQVDQAREAFHHAVSEYAHPRALDALIDMARQDDDETALVHWLGCKLPITEGKEALRLALDLAKIHEDAGRVDAQLEILEQARSQAPQDPKVIDQLVGLYLNQNRFDEAEPMIKQMITYLEEQRQMKMLSRYIYRLGQLAEKRGDLETAFDSYTRCKQSDATFAPNLIALSRLLTQSQKWEEAQETLNPLLLQRKVSPEERVEIFYLNGITRKALGDLRKAKDMFQRALAINANHERSKAELESL
jgi:tetratricopeptide (TPR) repeat protein